MNAEDIVKQAEAAYNTEDLDRIMSLFDQEIVFFWNGQKKAEGHGELRRWHEMWVGKQKDFTMRKTLRAASGDTIAVEWQSRWIDPVSGEINEGYGGEFWTMRNNRLREWRAYHTRYVQEPQRNA